VFTVGFAYTVVGLPVYAVVAAASVNNVAVGDQDFVVGDGGVKEYT
jgi:hypothetical protein